MIRATISEVKNGLSAYLRRVKSGESVLVMERITPVVRIVPVGHDAGSVQEMDVVDRDAKLTLSAGGYCDAPQCWQPPRGPETTHRPGRRTAGSRA